MLGAPNTRWTPQQSQSATAGKPRNSLLKSLDPFGGYTTYQLPVAIQSNWPHETFGANICVVACVVSFLYNLRCHGVLVYTCIVIIHKMLGILNLYTIINICETNGSRKIW